MAYRPLSYLATALRNGFMSAADKAKLDAMGSQQRGTVAFTAGVSTIAVVFSPAFSSPPVVTSSLDRGASAIQSWDTASVTAAGFTFRRGSVAGAATGNWVAIG